jgi:hypothetical protein
MTDWGIPGWDVSRAKVSDRVREAYRDGYWGPTDYIADTRVRAGLAAARKAILSELIEQLELEDAVPNWIVLAFLREARDG